MWLAVGFGLGRWEGSCVHQPLLKVLEQAHEQAALEAARLMNHVPNHAHPGLQASLHQAQQLKQPLEVCKRANRTGTSPDFPQEALISFSHSNDCSFKQTLYLYLHHLCTCLKNGKRH